MRFPIGIVWYHARARASLFQALTGSRRLFPNHFPDRRGLIKRTRATIAKLAIPQGKAALIVFNEGMPGFDLRLRAGGSAVWMRSIELVPSSGT
jgi:hypothetical protein